MIAPTSHLGERIKLFHFIRDIPYRIGLSRSEQDYCCTTKAPMLQKLLRSCDSESRRIWCRFNGDDFYKASAPFFSALNKGFEQQRQKSIYPNISDLRIINA